MIKIIETPYTREALEKIMNKKWETLVAVDNWLIISKITIIKASNKLAKTKTLLQLIKTLDITDFTEFWDTQHLKQVMKDFYIYWSAKNDWWSKERWQTEKVFDIKARYYTFLRRAKKDTDKKSATITTFW